MNKLTRQAMVGAAIALGVSGGSLADDGKKTCALDTLDGLYIFTATGYNIVSGVAQPKAIVEVIRFNGDGTLTVPAATHSINGVVAQSPPEERGLIPSTLGARAPSRLRVARALTCSSRSRAMSCG
jgi:hypothetical protein